MFNSLSEIPKCYLRLGKKSSMRDSTMENKDGCGFEALSSDKYGNDSANRLNYKKSVKEIHPQINSG